MNELFRSSLKLIIFLCFFIITQSNNIVLAQTSIISIIDKYGIVIASIVSKETKKFDIDFLSPDSGIKKIKAAIELVFEKSAFSSKIIKHLSEFGKILIIYDPEFPKTQLATQKIAAFFPDFFQHSGSLKQFRVIVGRYGILWPKERLAAVIVHELAGHGFQHLRKRNKFDRKIDRECEALIYEEKAYQDFNYPRNTPERLKFIYDIRYKWCADFNRFLVKNKINTDEAWGYGLPNIKRLLGLFEKYVQHLRASGVSANAIEATKKRQLEDFEQAKKKAAQEENPEMFFLIGKKYLLGLGIAKNYFKAQDWLLKAAKKNHALAYFLLGKIHENGYGVKANNIQAYKWFFLSVERGVLRAKPDWQRVKLKLSKQKQNLADQEVFKWKKRLKKTMSLTK